MIRCFFKLVLGLLLALGLLLYLWLGRGCSLDHFHRLRTSISHSWGSERTAGSRLHDFARTWGNPASLPDHFARHGADFGARTAEEYAQFAHQLLERARAEGLPAKQDDRGTLRVFDPRTGAFGAYNPDGTTKTFFKPGSANYFERQPGRRVDLRATR